MKADAVALDPELGVLLTTFFEKMDGDSDGKITKAEAIHYWCSLSASLLFHYCFITVPLLVLPFCFCVCLQLPVPFTPTHKRAHERTSTGTYASTYAHTLSC